MTNTEHEEWRPVPGFPGYEVSNHGRVRTIKSGRIHTGSIGNGGYPMVGLRRDNKTVTRTVHVLVAAAFIGPRPKAWRSRTGGPQPAGVVNHKDHDPTNNRPENLEYTTYANNTWHGRVMRHVQRTRGARLAMTADEAMAALHAGVLLDEPKILRPRSTKAVA